MVKDPRDEPVDEVPNQPGTSYLFFYRLDRASKIVIT